MIKKIKNYYKLKKTYKNAKMICVINGANIITNLDNIITKLNDYVNDNISAVNNISKEGMENILNFVDNMNNADFQNKVVEAMVKNMNNGDDKS